MAAPVIAVDPLYTDAGDAERLVDLAHRFGRYRIYGEDEHIDLDIGRGLFPRHDSVQHFLRTGGARGPGADVATLAARTSYFREEYAYDGAEHIGGVESFLHNPGLLRAAVDLYDRPIVEPAIAFANLMVPGQELAVHTDVPEFRGANRRVVPQWLLVVMRHSERFEAWRMRIATGISYFGDAEGGDLAYYPDGPDAPAAVYPPRHNTAAVLDTDTVFHGVDRVAGDDGPLERLKPGMRLHHEGGEAWTVRDEVGTVMASYDTSDLRYSVSWKAYCFADEAERDAWAGHRDDLTLDHILDTLEADLRSLDRLDGPRPPATDFGKLLIDTYIHFPAPAG